jgi:hypothetical protein
MGAFNPAHCALDTKWSKRTLTSGVVAVMFS